MPTLDWLDREQAMWRAVPVTDQELLGLSAFICGSIIVFLGGLGGLGGERLDFQKP
jgi:hypothetical protein